MEIVWIVLMLTIGGGIITEAGNKALGILFYLVALIICCVQIVLLAPK